MAAGPPDSRSLIVNADDFGFTTDVNAGIVEAYHHGILTAATLMANGAAFDHAVKLARRNPDLDIGCHLVLVGGKSVAEPGGDLPATIRQFGWRLLNGSRSWVARELEAQVERILAAGLQPSHLDTHKHTHLAPPVLEAVCRVSERFDIPWVRKPFDLPLKSGASAPSRALHAGLGKLRRRFERTLDAHHCRTTDHFAGFQLTGAFRAAQLACLIRSLPPGLTEFMCHPGHCTAELLQAPTRLKASREEELRALVSAEVRVAVEEAGVRLTDFRSE